MSLWFGWSSFHQDMLSLDIKKSTTKITILVREIPTCVRPSSTDMTLSIMGITMIHNYFPIFSFFNFPNSLISTYSTKVSQCSSFRYCSCYMFLSSPDIWCPEIDETRCRLAAESLPAVVLVEERPVEIAAGSSRVWWVRSSWTTPTYL